MRPSAAPGKSPRDATSTVAPSHTFVAPVNVLRCVAVFRRDVSKNVPFVKHIPPVPEIALSNLPPLEAGA